MTEHSPELPLRDRPFTGDAAVDEALAALHDEVGDDLDGALLAAEECHRVLQQRLQQP